MAESIITLYHGSYCEVVDPDLSRCAYTKDFGRGFYLTTSKTQAESFAKLTLRKARERKKAVPDVRCGVVSIFTCRSVDFKGLRVHRFETADIAWLRCVVAHRKPDTFPGLIERYRDYDVISGKIANDATNARVNAYMSGVFGDIESDQAAEICISLLLPERLQDQYCFRSKKALDILKFQGSEKVWVAAGN